MSSQKNNLFNVMKKSMSQSMVHQNHNQNYNKQQNSNHVETPSKQDNNTLINDVIGLFEQAETLVKEGRQKIKEVIQKEYFLLMSLKSDLMDAYGLRRQITNKASANNNQMAEMISAYQQCQKTLCQTFQSLIPTAHNHQIYNIKLHQSNKKIFSSSYEKSINQNQFLNRWFQQNNIQHFQHSSQYLNLLKPKSQIIMTPIKRKPIDQQQLYSFNNNIHYYQLCKEDESLLVRYKWTEQEDDALFGFRFDDEKKWQKQMRVVIDQKSIEYVIERYACLEIQLSDYFKNKIRLVSQMID